MYRSILVLVLFSCAAGCTKYSQPEAALQNYADAVIEESCDEAFAHLSLNTRRALEVLQRIPRQREKPLPIEEYYCRPFIFENCKWKATTLESIQNDTAKVSMMCGTTQDSFLPGFSSPFLKYEPRLTDLVKEEGEWRVVLPYVIEVAEMQEREEQMREAERRRQQEYNRQRIPRQPAN